MFIKGLLCVGHWAGPWSLVGFSSEQKQTTQNALIELILVRGTMNMKTIDQSVSKLIRRWRKMKQSVLGSWERAHQDELWIDMKE